jgi:hypothetical protein
MFDTLLGGMTESIAVIDPAIGPEKNQIGGNTLHMACLVLEKPHNTFLGHPSRFLFTLGRYSIGGHDWVHCSNRFCDAAGKTRIGGCALHVACLVFIKHDSAFLADVSCNLFFSLVWHSIAVCDWVHC